MYKATVIVPNKTGIHARPAADVVEYCKQFAEHQIHFIRGSKTLNAKSMISVLAGGLKQHVEFEVQVTGPREDEVGPQVAAFIGNLKD